MRGLIGRILEWFLRYDHSVRVACTNCYGDLPRYGYEGDAGYDLYCSDEITVPARGYANVPTSVRFQMPVGVWLLIKGRSSAMAKFGLVVTGSVIDNGYRGEMFVQVYNTKDEDVKILYRERIAQVIPFRLVPLRFRKGSVNLTERGHKGFGSSGR